MDDLTPPRHFHPPVSASTLLARLRISQIDPATGLKLPRLRTGVRDVDEYLLAGGVQRGCVVGVSSGITSPNRRDGPGGRGYTSAGDEEGDTGRLLTLHILARSLLERPHSHASIIDSTGSFPLALFAGVVRWCAERRLAFWMPTANEEEVRLEVPGHPDLELLRREGGEGKGGKVGGAKGKGGLEEKVNAVLERVGVTRVFDTEGLWEVLGEVGGGATGGAEEGNGEEGVSMEERGRTVEDRGLQDEKEGGEGDGIPREEIVGGGGREIMDSEEEDDEEDDLSTQRLPNPAPQTSTKDSTRNHKPSAPSKTHPTTEIILLDNLTTLITTLFSRTSTPLAHLLLSQLSLTLTTLARSSGVTIFLLNTLVRKSTKTAAGNPEHQRKKEQEKQHSVFDGMTATPSLGVVFDGFVDLHLMCFALPRGREDAEGVFGVELPGDDGELRDDEEDGGATGERGAR
ncbi:hypothetical protein V499_03946, partial [Pseudogymnoascus sp. VKM F-103]